MKSVLYVRLPCWKIYPGGIISVADYVHKHDPTVNQRIIDLSLIDPPKRSAYLADTIRDLKPDVVAFSWRNIQTFAPHDGSDALESVLKFDYSRSLTDKLGSSVVAMKLVFDFIYQLQKNLSFVRLAGRVHPSSQLVVGGTAFSCFPEHLIRKFPEGTIGVVGEGEDAMLRIIGEKPLDDVSVVKVEKGELIRHHCRDFVKLEDFTATDFTYISSIFPRFGEYLSGEVGLQTKRGCPHACSFCIYKIIEGERERFKQPSVIVEEMAELHKRYGVKKIWFVDSQFISSKKSLPVVEETLDRIIAAKLDVQWTGYLRIENVDESMARRLIGAGIESLDLSFLGSQRMIDSMDLGYSLERQMEAFRHIKAAGFDKLVKLYLPLNSPGETRETLLETTAKCRELYSIFGRDKVYPWLFFLGVQAGTRLEKKLIDDGYLKSDYNPLSYNPLAIKKLLYNPPPLGAVIAGSYLEALKGSTSVEAGRMALDIIEQKLTHGKAHRGEPVLST